MDDKGGFLTTSKGNRVKRERPPDCTLCPKRDFRHGWIGINEFLFNMYLISRTTGSLPFVGGITDQDNRFLQSVIILDSVERNVGRLDQLEILKAIFGVK